MKHGQFEQYVNMIRKSANFYAKKWNIDYDEVEAQGFLIYCQCLKDFDISKSSFSTYLSWELKRLNDFCKTYLRQRGLLIEDNFKAYDPELTPTDNIPARCENITLCEILEYSKEYLSNKAYNLLDWILGRTWEQKGRLKPSISLVMNIFHYSREQATNLWNEVGEFYRKNLCTL